MHSRACTQSLGMFTANRFAVQRWGCMMQGHVQPALVLGEGVRCLVAPRPAIHAIEAVKRCRGARVLTLGIACHAYMQERITRHAAVGVGVVRASTVSIARMQGARLRAACRSYSSSSTSTLHEFDRSSTATWGGHACRCMHALAQSTKRMILCKQWGVHCLPRWNFQPKSSL